MNLDCRVLSAACPRVFEECHDEIRHGLSTEKARRRTSAGWGRLCVSRKDRGGRRQRFACYPKRSGKGKSAAEKNPENRRGWLSRFVLAAWIERTLSRIILYDDLIKWYNILNLLT